MIRIQRRGTLIAVIACAVVFLTIGLVLASVTLADLNFASSYRAGTSDEFLAEAAIAQFMDEDQQLRQRSFVAPPDVPPPVDWLVRFRSPVFPDGGSRLPGTVNITFDSNKPYFSVDNSLGSNWVGGWSDRGRGTASVPPQTVSLVITTRTESHVSHYEALLQCRWPYALVAGAPIRLGGLAPPTSAPDLFKPITVNGPVLLLETPIQASEIPSTPGTSRSVPPIPTTPSTYDTLRDQMAASMPVLLGFSGDCGGNQLLGRLDSLTGLDVNVTTSSYPGRPNEWAGRARRGYGQQKLRERIASLFRLPDPALYTDSLEPADIKLLPPTDPLDPSPPKVYETNTTSIALGPANPGDLGGTMFYLDGSLVAPAPVVGVSPPSITLNNCQLFVNGDLDLGEGSIVGDNSTLIVNGNLAMRRGGMDAASNPMVIFCKRLSATASGGYRGLIVVEQTASFVDSVMPGGLVDYDSMSIQGGIICGGSQAPIAPYDPTAPPTTAQMNMSGCFMCSAVVNYDPRYLASVNHMSDYELIRLRRIE